MPNRVARLRARDAAAAVSGLAVGYAAGLLAQTPELPSTRASATVMAGDSVVTIGPTEWGYVVLEEDGQVWLRVQPALSEGGESQ